MVVGTEVDMLVGMNAENIVYVDIRDTVRKVIADKIHRILVAGKVAVVFFRIRKSKVIGARLRHRHGIHLYRRIERFRKFAYNLSEADSLRIVPAEKLHPAGADNEYRTGNLGTLLVLGGFAGVIGYLAAVVRPGVTVVGNIQIPAAFRAVGQGG